MPTDKELMQLSEQTNTVFARSTATLQRVARQKLMTLGNWYAADMARLHDDLYPMIKTAQLKAAEREAYYVSKILTLQADGTFLAATVPVETILDLMDDPVEIIRRTAVPLYAEIARPNGIFKDGLILAGDALEAMLGEVMSETRAVQQRVSLKTAGISRYRRVASSGACDHCLAIADGSSRYLTDDLKPLHPHCDCGVQPEYVGQKRNERAASQSRQERAYREDLSARIKDSAKQKTFLENSVTRQEANLDQVTAKWRDVDNLPDVQRARARKELGIARQRVNAAKKRLATGK